MTIPESESRPLRYPLKNPLVTDVDTGTDAVSVFDLQDWGTDDDTERINIVLNLSLQEYVALASAVDVGRDIAYGSNSEIIWWVWVRALISMNLCDDIAECITTSETVIQALESSIINNGIYAPVYANEDTTIVENTFPQSEREITPIQEPPASCDLDILWAGIRELVERLADQAKTVLENITAQADKFQRISEFLDAVPVVGGAADALIKNVVDSAQDMLNLFNAYDSINTRDDLACEIFQIVCNECRYPTYEELYEAIGNNAIGGMQDLSLLNVAIALSQFVLASSAAQSVAWHTLIAFELFVLYADSKFLNLYGKNAIGIMTSLGEDVPSSDWQTLCGGCVSTWCVEFDFSVNDGGFILNPGNPNAGGQYVGGVGWVSTYVNNGTGNFEHILDVVNNGISGGTATSWELDYNCSYTVVSPTFGRVNLFNGAATYLDERPPQNASGVQLSGTVNSAMGQLRVFANQGVGNQGAGSFLFTLTRLRINGTGVNPYPGQVCV